MLELREAKLYEHALPELEDELNRCARKADFQPEAEFKLLVCFGIARDTRFESFGRLLFDWFRCPALEVTVEPGRLAVDRPHPAAQHQPAGQRRGRVPARVAAPAHQARMARPQGARDRQIRSRGAVRSEREAAAVLGRPRSSISRASPKSSRSTSSRSPGASSPSSPNTTACSSARPPRSTTIPTGSPGAPGRKACRSSTTRSR